MKTADDYLCFPALPGVPLRAVLPAVAVYFSNRDLLGCFRSLEVDYE